MVSQNANGGGTRPGYNRRLGLRMRGPATRRLARVGAVTKRTVRLGVVVGGLACVSERSASPVMATHMEPLSPAPWRGFSVARLPGRNPFADTQLSG